VTGPAPPASRTAAGPEIPARISATLALLRGRVIVLRGWRRVLLALGLGALFALALPPFHLLPLAAVALPGLLWLIDGTRGPRGAFGIGWLFGFAHFLAGLFWIVNALLIFGWKFLPAYPIVVGLLPSILAFYVGLAAMATRAMPFRGAARVLAFAGFWVAAEWLRGALFTGFPWNLAGYAWAFSDAMLQLASVLGIWGLSLVAVAAFAMPAILAEPGHAPGSGWAALGVAALAVAGVYAFGAVRLAGAPPVGADPVPGVVLRIVQPNIEQVDKWDRTRREASFMHHLRLSMEQRPPAVTHVIWPETATPFFLAEQEGALRMVAEAVPPGGTLLTGTPRRGTAGGEPRLWNSLVAVDGQGRVRAAFDKFHLVPLGEYVPLKDYIPLTKLVQGASDYSPGPGPRSLRLDGLPPVSPLICYEVIFPGRVLDPADRPQWLLNVTNDGWYGDSPGPRQHFAIARLRAVEEGMPLVRSANTGISGIVDAYGRVVARLDLGRTGVIDAALPRALPAPTPFARLGGWGLVLLLVLAAAAVAIVARIEYRAVRI
jgi:apolipoprotein N-acyltransferase